MYILITIFAKQRNFESKIWYYFNHHNINISACFKIATQGQLYNIPSQNQVAECSDS